MIWVVPFTKSRLVWSRPQTAPTQPRRRPRGSGLAGQPSPRLVVSDRLRSCRCSPSCGLVRQPAGRRGPRFAEAVGRLLRAGGTGADAAAVSGALPHHREQVLPIPYARMQRGPDRNSGRTGAPATGGRCTPVLPSIDPIISYHLDREVRSPSLNASPLRPAVGHALSYVPCLRRYRTV